MWLKIQNFISKIVFGNEIAFLVSSVFGKRKRNCKRKIAFPEKRKRKRKTSFLSQPWRLQSALTPVFRMYPLLYPKFGNMVIFRLGNYIHFVAQETRIIRKLFFNKKVEIDNIRIS